VGTSLGSWHDFLEKFEVGALGVFSRSLAIVGWRLFMKFENGMPELITVNKFQ